ncbi:MAG: ABC transporter ATP-binding protein [Caldilineaceae bacterium]|nr:ABC transporter ATP-binding protein [Caldilineaceae bacterium]
MANLLSTQQLAVGYHLAGRTTTVLDMINVALQPGELTCLIGPNGAGKSTLMRTLAGMQPPLAGRVRLGEQDLQRLPPAQVAQTLAVVLTERVEVGNLSAYALVALGRHPYTDWRGRLREADEHIVRQAITTVGATHLAARPVSELSDGERQKVMIARALAQEPTVLLLDEPTAFLDLPRRVEMMQLLHTLARERQRAILLSTHDLDLALRIADRLWLLPAGGPLTVGMPEELAFNGALAQAFRSEGVEFDSEQGAFRIHRHACGPIGLTGQGAAALWTARALERLGYEVVNDQPQLPLHVSIHGSNGATRWQTKGPTFQSEHTSLTAVVEQLRGR